MNNIVCVTSPVSVGCSFIDWSIHFLSGKSKFYSVKNSAWIPVTDNPLLETTAHGHKKNHPAGHDMSWSYINQLSTISKNVLVSVYPHPLPANIAAQKIGIAGDLTPEKHKQLKKYQQDDYAKIINSFLDANINVVYVSLGKKNILYTKECRALGRLYFKDQTPKSFEEANEHLDQLFFADSINYWQQHKLTNIWDLRERLALCHRPFNTDILMEELEITRTNRYLEINAESMWYNGKNTIKKIMKFLNIDIDTTTWDHWIEVYYKWQQIQLNVLDFVINFEYIINAIVNNWHYEIGNLTFEQEIIIQHCLIYQHGLNLKTWQLEKFPSAAQDLHELLEPNIHSVLNIY